MESSLENFAENERETKSLKKRVEFFAKKRDFVFIERESLMVCVIKKYEKRELRDFYNKY